MRLLEFDWLIVSHFEILRFDWLIFFGGGIKPVPLTLSSAVAMPEQVCQQKKKKSVKSVKCGFDLVFFDILLLMLCHSFN